MIAKAIGPQNTVGAIGIMPRTVDTARQHDRAETGAAGIDGGVPDILSLRTLRLDLADQDHGILGDHAEQRQDAENGNEAQRPAGQQERRDDADQAERRYAEDQEQPLEALQLDHEDGEHDEQHDRHDGDDGGLRFLALFDSPADNDVDTMRGRVFAQGFDRRAKASVTTVSGRAPATMSACTVRVGTRSRRQIKGYSCPYSKVAN